MTYKQLIYLLKYLQDSINIRHIKYYNKSERFNLINFQNDETSFIVYITLAKISYSFNFKEEKKVQQGYVHINEELCFNINEEQSNIIEDLLNNIFEKKEKIDTLQRKKFFERLENNFE